jgi:hypothetical protein
MLIMPAVPWCILNVLIAQPTNQSIAPTDFPFVFSIHSAHFITFHLSDQSRRGFLHVTSSFFARDAHYSSALKVSRSLSQSSSKILVPGPPITGSAQRIPILAADGGCCHACPLIAVAYSLEYCAVLCSTALRI